MGYLTTIIDRVHARVPGLLAGVAKNSTMMRDAEGHRIFLKQLHGVTIFRGVTHFL